MHSPETAPETLLHPDWVLTMAPAGELLENHSIMLRGDAIAAILPRAEAEAVADARHVQLPGQVVLPGLVNAHGHAAMTLLRGYADDRSLMPWLQEHIWPAEQRHVSADFVRDGTALALLEMLRAGTTTFSDMYFFPDVVAELVQSSGLRCQLAFPVLDFPTQWAGSADEYISKGLALRDDCKHLDRLRVVFGPHSPYTVSEPNLARIATLAAELDLPVHIHLHETAAEVLQAVEANGERPIATLHRLGLLGPRTQCVHMTALGDDDIRILSETGASVVHCPQSNMKLASGTCPVARLLDEGIVVALGSDGAAGNNDLNLFGEMQTAALLAKLSGSDAEALPASQALYMATLGGARALGLDELIGSIEPGKQADLISVDLSAPETQPLYNPVSQLVYACNGSQVRNVWVAGQQLLADREPTTLDTAAILQRARAWQQKIAGGNASA